MFFGSQVRSAGRFTPGAQVQVSRDSQVQVGIVWYTDAAGHVWIRPVEASGEVNFSKALICCRPHELRLTN